VSARSRDEFADFASAALPTLMRLGHMLTGSADAGADLVQTALVSTLAAWPRVQREDPFGYVRRAMVNANVSIWRRWGARVRYVDPPDRQTDDEPGKVADVVTMRSALAALPPRQRTVLVLRYYCDLSEEEIAQEMGVRPGTVKSQAARGLATLRRSLCGEVPGLVMPREGIAR
jgi:RNA polymerase sigma-70 factor (sigma-E family)